MHSWIFIHFTVQSYKIIPGITPGSLPPHRLLQCPRSKCRSSLWCHAGCGRFTKKSSGYLCLFFHKSYNKTEKSPLSLKTGKYSYKEAVIDELATASPSEYLTKISIQVFYPCRFIAFPPHCLYISHKQIAPLPAHRRAAPHHRYKV